MCAFEEEIRSQVKELVETYPIVVRDWHHGTLRAPKVSSTPACFDNSRERTK